MAAFGGFIAVDAAIDLSVGNSFSTVDRLQYLYDWIEGGTEGAAYRTMLDMAKNPTGQAELTQIGQMAGRLIPTSTTTQQVNILKTIADVAMTLGR